MMNDPSQNNPRLSGIKNVRALVSSNVETNSRNHRTLFQPTVNGAKSFQERTFNGSRNGKTSSAKPLLECLQPEPLLTSKPFEKSGSQRRRRNLPFDQENLERRNDDEVNKPEISPGKTEFGRSTVDICEPTSNHLYALEEAFNKILTERSLSITSLQQRQLVFTRLHQLISLAKPECQVNLYGSMYFECALEKPGIMDIDIQLKETLQYDTLKELLDIINKSDLCKEARIETECKPSSISLITREPNMRVKLTSGYTRGIYLSKLLRIYAQMDSRVIKLLRLVRILSKICNTDKPELGTLHPVVFHIMMIHFLQQVDQPVLPCLHEYVYGVDHVPITLNENQYPEFFDVCEKYSRKWESKNTASVELLFLQFLSYYVKTFNTKQFVVSIQTRMPVMKLDKNWHSRKLLVEDPTDMKRSLCQTMQSVRSIDYFRDTFNAALNYFGREQTKLPTSDSSTEDKTTSPTIKRICSLHNSYKLFYKRLPAAVARDMNMKQGRVREYYKQTFDQRTNAFPQGILPATSSDNKFDSIDENDIQEALQHDLENNFENTDENDDDQNENHIHLLQTLTSNEDNDEQDLNDDLQQIQIEQQEIAIEEAFPINDEEKEKSVIDNTTLTVMNETTPEIKSSHEVANLGDDTVKPLQEDLKTPETSSNALPSSAEPEVNSPKVSPSSPIKIEATNSIRTDENPLIPSIFTSPTLLEQILIRVQSLKNKDSSEFFYDFQAEHFHAEQGAPYVCTTCNGVGHLKDECPELIVPKMIDLPETTEKWNDILSILCREITKRCKPTTRDTENRQQILSQLEKQCQKDYPECSLHAFGSFYNGFGFRQSDLDVCMVFKDEREQNNEEILRIMQKILRAMKMSNAFENVQPVLHAKVPIIRSRHRQLHIEIDISLHNMLAIENTRLLKTYTDIDSRVSELGYMTKHLAKFCGIGDASRGTLSSYAYIILLIHFLQQTKPAVLPVLQKLSDDPSKKKSMYKKCSKWNVYFYDDLIKINKLWKNENKSSTGALWLEFLRFYTEQFNYDEHIVTIRQIEPLLKHEKGWFRQTIAIEDPFELSHNLAGGLSLRNWTIIRRVFIRARQQFGVQLEDVDISKPDISMIETTLFDIDQLCPTNAPKRCEWCKGPYHIRKRCPKLAALSHEEDKRQRARNINEQYYQPDNNHYRGNGAYYYHNNAMNGYYQHQQQQYQHPKSAPTDQRPFRYTTEERPRDHHRMQDQPTTYPNRMYPSNNHRRACFHCGELGHMKANCPSSRKNSSNPRSNITS